MTDTIAAIATPYGSGGIGVIRISGPKAFEIADTVFSGSKTAAPGPGSTGPGALVSHRVRHGYILEKDEVIDEVLLIPMQAPRSYTAEDVVEIQAHSGTLVLRRILNLVLGQGARPAEPGEFTKRAFLNQRIDLTQAEAVADIINARSESALKFAASQNLGILKQEIADLRQTLVPVLSHLEAAIDFPDEVEDFTISPKERLEIDHVILRCQELIRQHEDACFVKTGIRVAICGRPNVGKSSLMNRLLAREKSIITALPGTTRDPIEEGMNIDGIPFVVIDTAGIHETDDLVEIIGIEKAREHIQAADIILLMKEPHAPYSEKDFGQIIPKGKRVVFVVNKMDLAGEGDLPTPPEALADIPVIGISALKDQGIGRLKEKLTALCLQDLDLDRNVVLPNLRHKNALQEAVNYLQAFRQGLDGAQEEDTLALDLKNTLDVLGTITGETASLDILDEIFNTFCIGK